MEDGSHQEHGLETNPHPKSELQRALPVANPKTRDKMREHKGDDDILNKLADQLPDTRFHLR